MSSIIPKRTRKPKDVKYEYMRVEIDSNTGLLETFNSHGACGWRMVDKEPRYIWIGSNKLFSWCSILFMRRKS